MRSRKAVSTLIGALIAISILFTVLIPLIYSMYAARRAVETAQEQRLSFLELKEREVLTLQYTPSLTAASISVTNKGPVEVAIVRLWVFTESGVQVIPITPPVVLKPGDAWSTTINVNPSLIKSVAIETGRGNVFAVKPSLLQAAVPVSLYNLVLPSTFNLAEALQQLQPAALVGGSIQPVNATQYPAVYRYLFTYTTEYVPVSGKGRRWRTYEEVISSSYTLLGEAPISDILFTTDMDGNGLSEIVFSTLGVTVDAINGTTGQPLVPLSVVSSRSLGLNSWIVTVQLKGPTLLRVNYNPSDSLEVRGNKTFLLDSGDWVKLWVYKPINASLTSPTDWRSGVGVINGTALYILIYHNTTKTTVRNTDDSMPVHIQWLYIEDEATGEEINITPQEASEILLEAQSVRRWPPTNAIDITEDPFDENFTPGALYVVRNGTDDQYLLWLQPGSGEFTVKFKVALPQAYAIEFGSKIGKAYSLALNDVVELKGFNGTVVVNITDPSDLKLWVGWPLISDSSQRGRGSAQTYVISSEPEEWNVVKLFINGEEIPDVPVAAMMYEKYGEKSTGPIYFILNKAPITNASAVQVSYRFFYYSSLGYVRDYGYTIDLNQIPNLRVFSVVLLRVGANGTFTEVASKDYYLQTLEVYRGEFGNPAFVADTATFVTNVTDEYYVALAFEDPYLAVTYTAYPLWWGGPWWARPSQITFTGQPLDVCVGVEYVSLTRFVPPP